MCLIPPTFINWNSFKQDMSLIPFFCLFNYIIILVWTYGYWFILGVINQLYHYVFCSNYSSFGYQEFFSGWLPGLWTCPTPFLDTFLFFGNTNLIQICLVIPAHPWNKLLVQWVLGPLIGEWNLEIKISVLAILVAVGVLLLLDPLDR